MAVTKTINGTVSQNADLYTYQLYCEEQSVDNTNNTSKLKVTVRIVTGGTSGTTYASRSASATHTVTINGTNYTFNTTSYSLVGQTTTTLGSVTSSAIAHNDDGTKTVSVSASSPDLAQGGGWGPYSGSASGSVTLTAIPRYTTITTFTASKRDHNTFTINWGTADTVDYVWYRYKTTSASSYGSWVGVDVTDGTSGSFTATGFSPNTSYNLHLKVRRKDSQLTTETTTAITQTTYQAPTQSVSSKTETSITMAWSIDTNADYIWYSKDNGTNWTAVGSVSAKTGSYTISSLTPNTTYAVRTRVRRASSQTTYDVPATSVTTYKSPSFSLASKTETSLTINWSADSTIDYVWYSTNNGSSYTGVDVTDGTSGSITISSLTALTTYNVKMKFRRKATQTTYTVPTAQQMQTYDYPKVSAIGSNPLTIGNQQTLTLYNPLGRSVTVKMYKNNTSGTQLYSGTTSGTSISFTPTASTLYNSIPNDQSANCVYTVTYSSTTKTSSTATYKIKGNEYPTFSASNFSYTANKTSLTNNNQLAIDKYSTITVKINTSATSAYGSTIDKYVIKWGDKTSTIAGTATTGTVAGGNGNTLTVTVYDTRGLPTEAPKTITNFSAYTDLVLNTVSTLRTNGVEAETKLSFTGKMYSGTFGPDGVTNAIYRAKYCVSTDGTNWSSEYPSDNSMRSAMVVSGTNFSLTDFVIHANGTDGGFTVGQQYYVKVIVKDASGGLSTVEAISIVTDGKIARDVYQDSNGNYHEGINGLANSNYTQKIYGKQQVTGDINGGGIIYTNGKTSSTDGISGVFIGAEVNGSGKVEISGATPHLDFHHNNSTANYTSRIIENNSGTLNINSALINNGVITGTVFVGKIRLIKTNPSTGTDYFLNFTDGGSDDTNYNLRASNGIKCHIKEGTESDVGAGIIWLGNAIASGTAGNKHGMIRIYDDTTYYSEIKTTGSLTDNRAYTLPNKSGTVALTTDTVTGATNATNTNITNTKPESATTYYSTFVSSTSGNNAQRVNDGFRYSTLEGTTDTTGRSFLYLGNGAASGTAGNKQGRLRLYSSNTGYANLIYTNSTSNVDLNLPSNANGYTLQTKPKNLYNNTSGTTGTVTLSESCANFTYIEIFFGKGGYRYQSVKVYSPNNKPISLINGERIANDMVQFHATIVTASTTSITHTTNGGVNLQSSSTVQVFTANEVSIYRVDGYK